MTNAVGERLEELRRVFEERARDAPGDEPTVARGPGRRRAFIGFIAVTAVLCLLVLVAFGLTRSAVSGLTVLTDDEAFPDVSVRPIEADAASEAIDVLVLGSDSREGLGDDIDTETATGQRSDTMMLVRVPSGDEAITVMSIMRDSWVTIPGKGQAKVNAAMSWGGVPLAVETVESLVGVRIEHVVVADFEGVSELSEALGGVEVVSPIAFESTNMPGYTFIEGLNTVEGEASLAFVRERYAFVDGDYQRVRNQRSFLGGAIVALSDSAGSFDVPRVLSAVGAMADHLSVSSGLDTAAIARIAAAASSSEVVSFTLPTAGTGTSADGQSIVVIDEGETEALRSAYADGDVAQAAQSRGWE